MTRLCKTELRRWCAVAALVCGPVAAPARPAAPPTAFLVAQGEGYAAPNKLPLTVPAAADLAAGFHKIGCTVHLTTDAASAASARKVITDAGLAILPEGAQPKAGVKGVVLTVTDDAPALRARCEKWLGEVAANKAPLAFLVFSGHGEEREPAAESPRPFTRTDGLHFLTVGDRAGTGGVALAQVRRTAMAQANGLPLVVVYNACRTPREPLRVENEAGRPPPAVPPKLPDPTDPTYWLARKVAFRIAPELAGKDPTHLAPTWLLAAPPGARAKADRDLVSYLSRAFSDRADLIRFLEWAYRNEPARVGDLTLRDWFLYAVTRQKAETGIDISPLVVQAGVPLETRIARLAGPGFTPVAGRDLVVDLRGQFLKTTGAFDVDPGPGPVLRVRHPDTFNPPATIDGQAYASGRLGPPDGLDPSGRALVVDCVASFHPTKAAAVPRATILAFHVQPSMASDKLIGRTNYVELGANANVYAARYGQARRITMPLVSGKGAKLDLLAFGAHKDMFTKVNAPPWEPGGVLTVFGLKVVPQPDVPTLAEQDLLPNLMSGMWAPYDRGAGNDEFLEIKPADRFKDGGYRADLGRKPGPATWARTAGLLTPPVFVPRGNVLRVEAKNPGPAPVTLSIDLLDLNDTTRDVKALTKHVVILFGPGESKAHPVVLGEEGFANFLALGLTGDRLLIKGITVLPEPPTKKR